MRSRAAWTLILVLGAGTGAASSVKETPLTLTKFGGWLRQVCASASCREIGARALVPGHMQSLPPESRVFLIQKAGEQFYLLHNVGLWEGQVDFQDITFLPARLSDRWTPTRMNVVAGWMRSLAGGSLDATKMSRCVQDLKRNGFPGQTLDNGYGPQALGVLRLSEESTAMGGCSWLAGRRNVAFGFIGPGKF